MKSRDRKISCREARELDLVNYLSSLGYEPVRIRGNNFWYCSPLRTEYTASFKINRGLNRWYDFGTGKGGTLIDFAIAYFDCTVGEFLFMLNAGTTVQQHVPASPLFPVSNAQNSGIEIIRTKPLFHPTLMDYLQERRIPVAVADRHCCEVHYSVNGNNCHLFRFNLCQFSLK